ncbi:hypothetical protein JCM19239_3973 [Vibrio variabilis]|uniref:Zn-dependent metallo-hydrolase RNA specificity domain-containing protein n=1 Tax=Vibrio variabilis TaxID=990271 RepID=A0ABQ0J666_9VIBR|nr:hypothetical protein JCM19239_3973 [Vibrio variabilis]
MSGYSAHADQQDLLKFVKGCSSRLKQIHLIHGDASSKAKLMDLLRQDAPSVSVIY